MLEESEATELHGAMASTSVASAPAQREGMNSLHCACCASISLFESIMCPGCRFVLTVTLGT
eukprot:COSAG06_NODE_244_length_19215_cov_20.256853_6_plen_62_part_00